MAPEDARGGEGDGGMAGREGAAFPGGSVPARAELDGVDDGRVLEGRAQQVHAEMGEVAIVGGAPDAVDGEGAPDQRRPLADELSRREEGLRERAALQMGIDVLVEGVSSQGED